MKVELRRMNKIMTTHSQKAPSQITRISACSLMHGHAGGLGQARRTDNLIQASRFPPFLVSRISLDLLILRTKRCLKHFFSNELLIHCWRSVSSIALSYTSIRVAGKINRIKHGVCLNAYSYITPATQALRQQFCMMSLLMSIYVHKKIGVLMKITSDFKNWIPQISHLIHFSASSVDHETI